jgi:transaldolase
LKYLFMIYLDSAIINEAQIAAKLGWVKGITTNPVLLAKSELPPEITLKQLAAISPGELYYQLIASDLESMISEGQKAAEIIGEKTVLKIPATRLGFQAVAVLAREIPCTVTAVYSGAQAAVAKEAGAKSIAVYVNRATKLLGDGLGLVARMADVLRGSPTEILAASLKSPEEAAAALQAGAHHLTLPLQILEAMTMDDLSLQTEEEFNRKGVGIIKN